MQSHFLFFAFVACDFEDIPKKFVKKVFPLFFLLVVLQFKIFQFLVHIVLIFVYGNIKFQIHSFICGYPVFQEPFVNGIAHYLLCVFDIIVKGYLILNAHIYFWFSQFQFSVSYASIMYFDYNYFVIHLKLDSIVLPTFFFLINTILTIWCLLWFHMNFKTFFYVYKYVIEILVVIILNLYIISNVWTL